MSLSKNKGIAIVLCTGAKLLSDQPAKIERKIVRSPEPETAGTHVCFLDHVTKRRHASGDLP